MNKITYYVEFVKWNFIQFFPWPKSNVYNLHEFFRYAQCSFQQQLGKPTSRVLSHITSRPDDLAGSLIMPKAVSLPDRTNSLLFINAANKRPPRPPSRRISCAGRPQNLGKAMMIDRVFGWSIKTRSWLITNAPRRLREGMKRDRKKKVNASSLFYANIANVREW